MISKNFPWRIFWRTFWAQLLGYSGILLSGFFIAYWYLPIHSDFVVQTQFQHNLGTWFKQVIPLLLIYAGLMSLYLSYRFVLPIGSVIGRARAMLSKEKVGDPLRTGSDETIYEEEVGEYFELEQTLRRIRRKLKKKREQVFVLREEHEALLTAMTDAVVTIDMHQKLTSFNSQFLTHFMDREQLQSEPHLADVVRQPEVLSLFVAALEKGQVGEVEAKCTGIDSRKGIFLVKVSALIKKKTGEIYGALGVFHDITELKRAEQIRIEFVENASHELRTPLTSVKGYVDTLKEDIEAGHTENLKSFMEVIYRNVGRLVNLVDDLLLISKLESNAELIIEDVSPEQVTRNIQETLSAAIKAKNQNIKVTVAVEKFQADSLKVEQVLLNLFSNAIKYTPAGSAIEIDWSQDSQKNIFLSVKDNGPGIPQTHLSRLFERFYRVDKGRSRESGGTGLGLSIVKHIMQNHGGWVKVKTDPHIGTEFICCFPQVAG